MLAQPGHEFDCTGQRLDRFDNVLNFFYSQLVLSKYPQTTLHEQIIVRLFACSNTQLFYSGFFGEFDPDFRDQHPFQIEAGYFHKYTSQVKRRSQFSLLILYEATLLIEPRGAQIGQKNIRTLPWQQFRVSGWRYLREHGL